MNLGADRQTHKFEKYWGSKLLVLVSKEHHFRYQRWIKPKESRKATQLYASNQKYTIWKDFSTTRFVMINTIKIIFVLDQYYLSIPKRCPKAKLHNPKLTLDTQWIRNLRNEGTRTRGPEINLNRRSWKSREEEPYERSIEGPKEVDVIADARINGEEEEMKKEQSGFRWSGMCT